MTGKFNNSMNRVCLAYCIVPLVIMFGGAAVVVNLKLGPLDSLLGTIIVMILLVLSILLAFPLRKCEYSADDEKIVIREVFPFIKRTYRFSEIKSASSQVGLSHSRSGTSARVELTITLSDGEDITFYDEDVPDEALSTPENHKTFQDTHQFTALCQYINERASG